MTASIANRKEIIFGNKRIVEFDLTVGAYTGGSTGVSLDPSVFGISVVDIVIIEPSTDGYIYNYDYTNKSVMAYNSGGASQFTATVSAPSVTVTATGVHVSGPTGAGIQLQLTNSTTSGKISKTAATNRTIPLNTFGIPTPTAVLATAPTFSATTAQAALFEVSSATLSTAVHVLAIGN
jgi:hypothetical protein